MKNATYFVQAYEYLLSLGAEQTLLINEILPPASLCYQSLRVAAFDPAYLISVLQIEDMAELTFCAQVSCNRPLTDANATFRWITAVSTALERGDPLPATLPTDACFVQSRSMLTPSQLDWLQAEMERIQPLTLRTTEQDTSSSGRDGEYLSGSLKMSDGKLHTFYWLNGDDETSMLRQYHHSLYKLAASTIKDPQCVHLLKTMTLNKNFLTPSSDGFTFPLIP